MQKRGITPFLFVFTAEKDRADNPPETGGKKNFSPRRSDGAAAVERLLL